MYFSLFSSLSHNEYTVEGQIHLFSFSDSMEHFPIVLILSQDLDI